MLQVAKASSRSSLSVAVVSRDRSLRAELTAHLGAHGFSVRETVRVSELIGCWGELDAAVVDTRQQSAEGRTLIAEAAGECPIVQAVDNAHLLSAVGLAPYSSGWIFIDADLSDAPKIVGLATSGLCTLPRPIGFRGELLRRRLERLESLSQLECRILSGLATGATDRMLADRLRVTESDIKFLCRRILRRLGLRNRTEAAVFTALYVSKIAQAEPAQMRDGYGATR